MRLWVRQGVEPEEPVSEPNETAGATTWAKHVGEEEKRTLACLKCPLLVISTILQLALVDSNISVVLFHNLPASPNKKTCMMPH